MEILSPLFELILYAFLLYSIVMTIFARGSRNSGMPGNMNTPFTNGIFGGGNGFRKGHFGETSYQRNIILETSLLVSKVIVPNIFLKLCDRHRHRC